MEIKFFQNSDMIQGAFNHGFRGRIAVFLQEMALQGTGIDADTDRNAFFLTGFDNCFDFVPASNVTRIDAHLVDAVLYRQQSQLIIKMNIRHQRNMNPRLNLLNCCCRFFIVDRHAHKLTARFFQPQDFGYCCFDISCFGCTHALNSNLVVSPNNNPANIDGTGLVSQEHGFLPHNDQSSTPSAPLMKRDKRKNGGDCDLDYCKASVS
ncbi:hypothetical protein D3C75_837230 [compost metagenome]